MFQFFLSKYILGILEQFGIENYTWRLDIVQNLCEFFLSEFFGCECANGSNTADTSKPKFADSFCE